ncbi:hypothetical protein CRG98_029226 [Punica granatum]|uniref:DUF7745 domain-containing protein n=1 Tax=Punica granatum TaxID=22663 RepID=A0A2I0J2D3_PUNGR|nr:hypothetical protein CRG98_029226 [Punica granatum]
MDRSHPCLRLDVIITPFADITRLWNTCRPVDHAFLRLIIGDLPLLADSPIDWTLLRTAISFWDTQRAVFSFQGSELAPTVEEYAALIQRPMPTRDIVMPNQFATIQSRLAILLDLRDEEIRHELQHEWEHSIRTTWLIDFIHVRSLNARGESYQRDACHGFLLLIFRTILFPHSSNLIDGVLAQVILQMVGGRSYVKAVLAKTIQSLDYVFRPSDRDYTDWIQFFKRLTPAQFLWAARWNPGGPMTIGCPSVIGLPLISHLGSTLVFPAQVIRQLGGLQDVPIEAYRTPYRFVWTDIIALLPDRGLTPVRLRHLPWIPNAPQAGVPDAESSVQGAIRTELQSIREERDRLRCELVDICAEHIDHRELQSELAQIRVHIANQDREIALHSGVPIGHPPPTAQTTSKFDNPARFTALEGMVNHLATNMATNMTELMVMLRNQNQASSSFTPPSEHRPIVDPNPTIPPTLVSDVEDASFSAMAFAPTVHPISDSLPPPPAPTAVPLPPTAFLSTDSTMHTLPPLTVSMHPPIYTVPPPTVPPVVLAQAPAPMADHFPFQALQPQTSFPYQALPPLNIPPTQPGMPNQVAPPALPTNIPSENEQERRMKRMEETIRALQASTSCLDFGDSDWNLFPGMLLPPKIKIPDFKRYDGTTGPRHHLRHYHSKMLSYWDYEEFVI